MCTVCFIQLCWKLGKQQMVSCYGNISFLYTEMNKMHKHTCTSAYSISYEDVGWLQAEIRKGKKGSKGKKADREVLYLLIHMGNPDLKYNTNTWLSIVAPNQSLPCNNTFTHLNSFVACHTHMHTYKKLKEQSCNTNIQTCLFVITYHKKQEETFIITSTG